MTAASFSPDNNYRIEPAGWRDTLAIYRLERIVFPRDTYLPPEILFLLLWPGIRNLKVVTPGGGVVGYISAGKLPGGGRTWIMTIGVHPDHQRRGLGSRLLATVEAALTSPTIYLTVRASNTAALRLYERAGYRRVGVKHGYYADGEDGIEMRKDRPAARLQP